MLNVVKSLIEYETDNNIEGKSTRIMRTLIKQRKSLREKKQTLRNQIITKNLKYKKM